MRRSSRFNSLFSFVIRHSLVIIRLLLHRQLNLPILQKKLSGQGANEQSETLCNSLAQTWLCKASLKGDQFRDDAALSMQPRCVAPGQAVIIRGKILSLVIFRQFQANNLPRASQILNLFALEHEIDAARITDY